MQDGATPHRTKKVFKAIYNVYGNRVIGLGYLKFAHGGIEWPPYPLNLNPCDFFLWGYIRLLLFRDSNNNRLIDESYYKNCK